MTPFTVPTLRDRFACHIAAGYLAAHAGPEIALPRKAEIAEYAYAVADALLVQRDKAVATPAPAAHAPGTPAEVPPAA